ncbi:MAG: hypothetical protein NTV06_01175 [candidate division Zixibacteria bacterium]|nr:hypothetical protein [candidate division Zixibacteria bacterium]
MNEILQKIITLDPTGICAQGIHFIQIHFGNAGVIAAAVLLFSIALLIVSKILRIAFDVLRYVVVPSIVVTFIGTFFLPYSFGYILPATVALFSLILIVKG